MFKGSEVKGCVLVGAVWGACWPPAYLQGVHRENTMLRLEKKEPTLYVPGLQSAHAVLPLCEVLRPGLHSAHGYVPRPSSALAEPTSQGAHDAAEEAPAAEEYVPAGHAWQAPTDVAPGKGL